MFFGRIRNILLIVTCITCIVGFSLEAHASENIIGLWKNTSAKNISAINIDGKNTNNKYYYFGKDGIFALPEQIVDTGVSWELSEDNMLALVIDFAPAGAAQKEFFTIVTLEKNKMVLQDANGENITFEKMKNAVSNIRGKLMYRERMALPPLVETRVQLYVDDKLFAASSLQARGQIPLPFSLYFIERKKDTKITLEASIYSGYSQLFGTIDPVAVGTEYIHNTKSKETEAKELDVLLYRSKSMEKDARLVISPAAYKSENGEYILYLEGDGFGILKDENNAETVQWNQVGRNHNIEIIRGAKEPLVGVVRPKNIIVFDTFDGKNSLSFSLLNEQFSTEKLRLTGMYTEMGAKGYFTDCNSRKQFVLDFGNIPTLHNEHLRSGKNASFATIDALVSRNNDGLSLGVKNLESLETDKKCSQSFQNAEITNTYWRLVTLNGKTVEQYQDQKEAHIIIRDDLANGSDGCNNFFMPVTITGEDIKFGQGGSTMMMCPQGDNQSREFLQTLNKVTAWTLNGSVLKFKKDDETILVFEAVYL